MRRVSTYIEIVAVVAAGQNIPHDPNEMACYG
jgi:hypothetical protein